MPPWLTVYVADGSTDPPRLSAGRREIGGEGLRVVAALADTWGFECTGDGKVVWVRLRVTGR